MNIREIVIAKRSDLNRSYPMTVFTKTKDSIHMTLKNKKALDDFNFLLRDCNFRLKYHARYYIWLPAKKMRLTRGQFVARPICTLTYKNNSLIGVAA